MYCMNCLLCCKQAYSAETDQSSLENPSVTYFGPKTTLSTLCRTLKIPRYSYSPDEYSEFEAPICSDCDTDILKIKDLLDDLRTIRTNLSLVRKRLLTHMIEGSNIREENQIGNETPSHTKIRNTILKDLTNSVADKFYGESDFCNDTSIDLHDGSVTPPRLDDISEGLPLPSPTQSFTSELIPVSPPKPPVKSRKTKKQDKTNAKTKCVASCFEDTTSLSNPFPNSPNTSQLGKCKRKIKKPEYLQMYHHIYSKMESSDDEKPLMQIACTPDPTWAPQQRPFGLDFESSQSQTFDFLQDKAQPDKPPLTKRKKQTKKTLRSTVRPIEIHVIGPDGKSLESIQTVGMVEDDVPQTLTVEGMLKDEESVVSFKNQIYGKRFPCNFKGCMKTFTEKNRLDLHFKKVHEGIVNPYQCETCMKSFKRPHLLNEHTKNQCAGESGEANSLSEVGAKRKRKNKQNRVTIKNHECEHCAEKFRNPGELTIHVRKVHTGETPFMCPHCEKSFVSALRLEFHTEQDHNEVAPLKCEYCTKGFFREYRLRDHRKTHTGEKSYLCEICSKSFTQPAYLRYHQTQHDELDFQPYKCEQCNKRFATPANLKLHVTTQHEKFYRYRCEICQHGSTHLSHLKLHMRTHTGERPFTCDFCSKGFMRGAQLKIHLRSHSGERPYRCKSCDKGFTNSSKLRRHELLHTAERNFPCNECERAFTTKSYLNSHIKVAHKVDIKEENIDELPTLHGTILSHGEQKSIVFIQQRGGGESVILQDNGANLFPDVETTVQYGEFILL